MECGTETGCAFSDTYSFSTSRTENRAISSIFGVFGVHTGTRCDISSPEPRVGVQVASRTGIRPKHTDDVGSGPHLRREGHTRPNPRCRSLADRFFSRPACPAQTGFPPKNQNPAKPLCHKPPLLLGILGCPGAPSRDAARTSGTIQSVNCPRII